MVGFVVMRELASHYSVTAVAYEAENRRTSNQSLIFEIFISFLHLLKRSVSSVKARIRYDLLRESRTYSRLTFTFLLLIPTTKQRSKIEN